MYLHRFKKIKNQYWDIVSFGLVAKALNFVKIYLISSYITKSYNIEEYNVAFSSIMFLTPIIADAIILSLISSFQKLEVEKGKDKKLILMNKMVNNFTILGSICTIFTILYAPSLVSYVAPELGNKELLKVVSLVRLGSPIILLHFLRAVCGGFLQSEHRFISGAKSGVLNVLVYIVYLLIFKDKYGVKGLMIASVLAVLSQVILMMRTVIKDGYSYKPELDIKDKYYRSSIKHLMYIVIIGILSNLLGRIDALTTNKIGATAYLKQANKVLNIINSLFITAIITTTYPILSRNYKENNKRELKKNSKFAVNILFVILIPISLIIFLLSKNIIFLQYNNILNNKELITLSKILKIYALGFSFSIIKVLGYRMLYTIDSYYIAVRLTLAYLIINHGFNIILVDYLGIYAIALSHILSDLILSIYTIYIYNKKVIFIEKDAINKNIKIILGSALSMLVIMFIFRYISSFLFKGEGDLSFKYNLINIILISTSGSIMYFLSMKDSLKGERRNGKNKI